MDSHHGHDKDVNERIPLTSDQDGVSNGTNEQSSSSINALLANNSSVPEAVSGSYGLRSISTEPVLSRDASQELADSNVTRLSFLHDEVDKMFTSKWPFEASASNPDPNCHMPEVSPMSRACSKLALTEFYHVDEAEYSRHRRVSYPHIHQPLRSLSSKSLSKPSKSHKSKKKHKKKKRKEKLCSFPSRNAIQSPPILEEEEHSDLDQAYSSSSTDSEEEELDDLIIIEEEREGLALLEPKLEVSPRALSSSPPKTLVISPTPPQELDGLVHTEQETSPDGKMPVSFFVGSEEPSPIKDFTHEMIAQSFQTEPNLAEFDIDDKSPLINKQQSFEDGRGEGVMETVKELLPPTLRQKSDSHKRRSMSPRNSYHEGGKVKFMLGFPSESNFNEPEVGDEDHQAKKRTSTGSDSVDAKISREPSEMSVPSSASNTSSRRKHHHHHHHQHFRQEHLVMRRQKGSEVHLSDKYKQKSPTETDEVETLNKADLDDMSSHRFEDQRGIRRHKISTRSKGTMHSIVHIGKNSHEKKKRMAKKFDHSPHEMFVELDELHFGGDDMVEWREKARWIKFEEDVEEGAERWGKPHVASLSFNSLLELRRGLERGTLLLDLEATDLSSIIHNVVENLVIRDLVEEEVKGKLLHTLLLKHRLVETPKWLRHVSGRSAFLRRSSSYTNLAGLDSTKRHQAEKGLIRNLSSHTSMSSLQKNQSQLSLKQGKGSPASVEMVKMDVDNNLTNKVSDGVHVAISPVDQKKHVQDIMRRIPKGSEASTVLVGQVAFLKKPCMAFVRLAEGQVLDNLTEVPLPVRFLFVLLGPTEGGMDYHEVGRSLSTLMSNQQFHETAYRAETREDLLQAINRFLEDSIVLPPGDWDHRTLLPITHMARKRAQMREKLKKQQEEKDDLEPAFDPLVRTGNLFGGVVNDVKRRYPLMWSDFKDGLNLQCIATLFFIFFTCLSPCIAFGGLLSEKTNNLMGVGETMLATSLFGMLFSIFSGQPLLILGATGPVLVFEESLYKFCESSGIEFLPVRFWVGFWVFVITTIAIALEGSFLIRYVTRFTEEIFAMLISLIFIYEVVKKLMKIFKLHPLLENYCDIDVMNQSMPYEDNSTEHSIVYTSVLKETSEHGKKYMQPNTALTSLIFILGTFLIAYFLRIFRNSKFFGRSVRRALGDFGVLIALALMTMLSNIMKHTYVQTLDMAEPFETTNSNRTWIINPLGPHNNRIPLMIIPLSILPAFLIFILLFMETQITEMILNKKERKLKKGSGYHIDQLVLGTITLLGGMFGLPWMCAATVRTVAHVSSLSEYSRTHAPGEKPKLLGVKEQKLTNFAVHFLIGASMYAGSVLKTIPVPALFGVFLYLGASALSGVQMYQRIKLLLMPVKYHPSISYVRKVRTIKMNAFTLIQLFCLIILLIIKSTMLTLSFPIFLLLLVPLRYFFISRFFTHEELEELDKEEEAFDLDDEDDPDFYQQAHMPI